MALRRRKMLYVHVVYAGVFRYWGHRIYVLVWAAANICADSSYMDSGEKYETQNIFKRIKLNIFKLVSADICSQEASVNELLSGL